MTEYKSIRQEINEYKEEIHDLKSIIEAMEKNQFANAATIQKKRTNQMNVNTVVEEI